MGAIDKCSIPFPLLSGGSYYVHVPMEGLPFLLQISAPSVAPGLFCCCKTSSSFTINRLFKSADIEGGLVFTYKESMLYVKRSGVYFNIIPLHSGYIFKQGTGDIPNDAIELTIQWIVDNMLLGGLIGTASAEKDGLMGKEYTIRYIYNAGLSISYYANGISFYSTTSLIELFLYSTGSVAYYRILATPKKNIIIRYLGDNDCDFKLNGNILYVLPRHTDITIKYKIGLYRNDIPDFATISISDFANITGNIITPTAG